MRWILLDLTLAVAALVVLVLAGLSLWRRVKALSRQLAAAGDALGRELAAIEQQQPVAAGRGGAGGVRSGPST